MTGALHHGPEGPCFTAQKIKRPNSCKFGCFKPQDAYYKQVKIGREK